MNHQDVACTEIFGVSVGEIYVRTFESERNGLAVEIGELVRLIEQAHIHTTTVGAVVVNYLVISLGYGLLAYQVFENETVLYLGNAENGVPATIVLSHLGYYLSHITLLDVVFFLCPLVLSLRKELAVVLNRIVIDIEKILQIIESYYEILLGFLGRGAENH